MKVKIEKDTDNTTEQTNKLSASQFIFESVKNTLSKDQFGLFKIKSSNTITKQTQAFNKKIEKLIQLKSAGSQQVERLTQEITELKTENETALNKFRNKLHVN